MYLGAIDIFREKFQVIVGMEIGVIKTLTYDKMMIRCCATEL